MGICKSSQIGVINCEQWTIIDGKKYNMEELLKVHPGGKNSIQKIIGTDGTQIFRNRHSHQYDSILRKYEVIGETTK